MMTGISKGLIECSSEPWTAEYIVDIFPKHLKTVSRRIQQPLTMNSRTLVIVTRDDLRPKTEQEKQGLRERYGEYIVEGGIGDCDRKSDGTFIMRVGYLGREKEVDIEEVLGVAAHEYGHTLGYDLDPVNEELKADIMEYLIMNNYRKDIIYENFTFDDTTVHRQAMVRMEQLMEAGIPPQAILAHLIGENFGEFGPEDWRDLQR